MKEYARLILVLVIPLLLVSAYSLCGGLLNFNGWTISKARLWQKELAEWMGLLQKSLLPSSAPEVNVTPPLVDTLSHQYLVDSVVVETQQPDTCSKRILLLGDSMVEGLSMRLSDYARENGHTLYSVCWYGSSTTGWANNLDTLQSFLRWSDADYVLVSLGGNELRVKDTEFRANNVMTIQQALGTRPTVWIAPPSWVKNPTITEVIRSVVGDKRYFDSTRLTYQRGSDNMHPTFHSAAKWMDSIAVWMSSPQTAHPIKMDFPKGKYPRKWKKKFIFPKK